MQRTGPGRLVNGGRRSVGSRRIQKTTNFRRFVTFLPGTDYNASFIDHSFIARRHSVGVPRPLSLARSVLGAAGGVERLLAITEPTGARGKQSDRPTDRARTSQ